MGTSHDVFRDVKESQRGRSITKFLRKKANIKLLENASRLGHPAVAGVAPELEAEFGSALEPYRVRQAVGSIIKDILVARGYHIAGTNLKVRTGNLFTRGCRYEKD